MNHGNVLSLSLSLSHTHTHSLSFIDRWARSETMFSINRVSLFSHENRLTCSRMRELIGKGVFLYKRLQSTFVLWTKMGIRELRDAAINYPLVLSSLSVWARWMLFLKKACVSHYKIVVNAKAVYMHTRQVVFTDMIKMAAIIVTDFYIFVFGKVRFVEWKKSVLVLKIWRHSGENIGPSF